MKKKFVIISIYIFCACNIFASIDMLVYKTAQFTLLFPPGYEVRALSLLSELEAYKNIPENILDCKLYNLPVILEDAGQYIQGYANPTYYKMSIFNREYEEENWFRFGAIHEYTHLLQMTKADGVPKVLTAVFGNIASPNLCAPNWIFEGITVYNESQISPYSGRLNNGGYDAFLGMITSEGLQPDIMKGSYAPFEEPFGNAPYLYGGEFFGYLSDTYGSDKIKSFFKSYGSSVLSYFNFILPMIGMDNTFREIYGKSTEELWKSWSITLKEKYKDYKIEGEKVSNRGFYTSAPLIYKDKLYYIYNGAEKTGVFNTWSFNSIIEHDLKSNSETEIVSRTSMLVNDIKIIQDKLYFCASQRVYGYPNSFENSTGIESVIYKKNLQTGEETKLFQDLISAYCVSSENKIYYFKDEKYKFGSKLFVFDIKTFESKMLFETNYVVTSIQLTQDGKTIIAAARSESTNRSIYSVDLTSGKFKTLIDTPWDENSPSITANQIFFSSNMDKKIRIYSYNMADGKTCRLTKNGTAGSPVYDEKTDEIYFVGLNKKGFDIYREKAVFEKFSFPVFDLIQNNAAAETLFTRGSYMDNLATLYPKIRYPLFDYYDTNSMRLGVGIIGVDAAEDFNYDASIFYDTHLKKAGSNVNIGLNFLRPVYLSVGYGSISGNLNLAAGIPLYINSLGGLSNIGVSFNYLSDNAKPADIFIPQIVFGFEFPLTKVSLRTSYNFKYLRLSSKNSGGTYEINIDAQQYLPASVMEIKSAVFMSNSKKIYFSRLVRGYDYDAIGKRGVFGSIEIFKPLIEIHSGLWNPNVFFQDLVFSCFCDSAFTDDNSMLSFGAALHLETMIFFNVPMDIGISEQRTKESIYSTSFIFKVLL